MKKLTGEWNEKVNVFGSLLNVLVSYHDEDMLEYRHFKMVIK